MAIQKDPMIICISDIHLGAGKTYPDLFQDFLIQIEKKMLDTQTEQPALLIILGDVFDVMMNTYENISKDYLHVFKLLDNLYEKGLKIIITLGNHEVSVTGDYDSEFTARKIYFIKQFQENLQVHDYKPKFLNKRYICQYAILTNKKTDEKDESAEWELFLYDSKYQIPNKMPNNIKPIKLGSSNIQRDFSCLFCHGYQFFKNGTKWAGEFIWNVLLNAKPSVKENMNKFYNSMGVRDFLKKTTRGTKDNSKKIIEKFKIENKVLNSNEIDIDTSQESENSKIIHFIKEFNKALKNLSLNNYKKIKEYVSEHFFLSILNKMAQTDEIINQLKKMKDIDEQLISFLKNEIFNNITHVVYGHTHNKIESEYNEIIIVNDGAWQHTEPSYVLIYNDGNIELHDFPSRPIYSP